MKQVNWKTKRLIAKGMTDAELQYAIEDCSDCIAKGVPDEGYYADERSVYLTERYERAKKAGKLAVGFGKIKVRVIECPCGFQHLEHQKCPACFDALVQACETVLNEMTHKKIEDELPMMYCINTLQYAVNRAYEGGEKRA